MCKEQAFPRHFIPFPQLCLLSANNRAGQIRARYLQPGRRGGTDTENLIWIFHPAVLIRSNLFDLSPQHLRELHQDVWVLLSKYDCGSQPEHHCCNVPTCRKPTCNRRLSLPFCKMKKKNQTLSAWIFCRSGGGRNKKKITELKRSSVVFNRTLVPPVNEYFTWGQKSSKSGLETKI